MKKIVVIGGGTGTFVVLSGIKNYHLDLSVIVSMMDSGGSTGRLRDQLGVLPPGDLRQCLVALSDAPELWRKLFLYRFENGDLKGHNFGNIFISGLEKISENYKEVLGLASYILKTSGKVIPVTLNKSHLLVEYEDGVVIEREGNIDLSQKTNSRIKKARLKPYIKANPEAIKAILSANYLILGPGDLYTSIIPNLLFDEIKVAISKFKGSIIYISNLVTKIGQTSNYKVSDHLIDIEKYLGRHVNVIVINNEKIDKKIVEHYEKSREKVVLDDLNIGERTIIRSDIVSTSTYLAKSSDKVPRSILRHDSYKLAKILWEIISNQRTSLKSKVTDALSDAKYLITS